MYVAAGDEGLTNANGFQLFNRVVAVDLATGRQRTVFEFPGARDELPRSNEITIALSPDGRTFAILNIHTRGKASLARVSVDGTGYHELYTGFHQGAGIPTICWGNDGRSILFAQETGKDAQIMRISADGGTPEPVGGPVTDLRDFALSPEGSRLAYSTVEGAVTYDVYALDLSAWLKGA